MYRCGERHDLLLEDASSAYTWKFSRNPDLFVLLLRIGITNPQQEVKAVNAENSLHGVM